ncbi:MAG: hypothetical protein Q4F33_06950 [Mycoplasmatota bacterium]|nr:hypothetical protein [Mycoplasmatota bacterium]
MKRIKKEISEKKLTIKMFLCSIYLIVITILAVCSHRLFQEKYYAKPWGEVESVEEYSYIEVSKMSEKFAYYEEENLGIHFVIEKEDTGLWHTYLIGINEDEYNKYKDIIDYTYERTDKEPTPLKVYGYPEIIKEDLKELAIKNVANFVPAENEIKITKDNFETYLTNSYLNTTKEKTDRFSLALFISLILLFVMIALFIFTIFDKDNILYTIPEEFKEKVNNLTKKFKNKIKRQ